MLAFGMPGAEPPGRDQLPVLLGVGRPGALLRRLRRRGDPGRHRVDPPLPDRQRGRARALAGSRRCATSSCRRASAASIPPLLNDFISLQKDTALVGAAGLFDALFAAQDYANYHFNFTPYVVVAVLLHRAHDPAGPVHRPAPAPRAWSGRGRAPDERRAARGHRRPQVVRRQGRAARHRPHRATARRGLPDRLVRLGQVDPAALPQPARGHRRRRDPVRRPRDLRPAGRPARGAQPDGDGLPGLQPVPPPDRARQLHAGAAARARRTQGRGGAAGPRPAGPVRARRPGGQAPRPDVGRPAAAGRAGARAVHAARPCCCSTRSPPRSTRSWSARC